MLCLGRVAEQQVYVDVESTRRVGTKWSPCARNGCDALKFYRSSSGYVSHTPVSASVLHHLSGPLAHWGGSSRWNSCVKQRGRGETIVSLFRTNVSGSSPLHHRQSNRRHELLWFCCRHLHAWFYWKRWVQGMLSSSDSMSPPTMYLPPNSCLLIRTIASFLFSVDGKRRCYTSPTTSPRPTY